MTALVVYFMSATLGIGVVLMVYRTFRLQAQIRRELMEARLRAAKRLLAESNDKASLRAGRGATDAGFGGRPLSTADYDELISAVNYPVGDVSPGYRSAATPPVNRTVGVENAYCQ
ncbi:hypothetical protein [Caballeronia sp. KNU42]